MVQIDFENQNCIPKNKEYQQQKKNSHLVKKKYSEKIVLVVQLNRIPRFERGDWGFESLRGHKKYIGAYISG